MSSSSTTKPHGRPSPPSTNPTPLSVHLGHLPRLQQMQHPQPCIPLPHVRARILATMVNPRPPPSESQHPAMIGTRAMLHACCRNPMHWSPMDTARHASSPHSLSLLSVKPYMAALADPPQTRTPLTFAASMAASSSSQHAHAAMFPCRAFPLYAPSPSLPYPRLHDPRSTLSHHHSLPPSSFLGRNSTAPTPCFPQAPAQLPSPMLQRTTVPLPHPARPSSSLVLPHACLPEGRGHIPDAASRQLAFQAGCTFKPSCCKHGLPPPSQHAPDPTFILAGLDPRTHPFMPWPHLASTSAPHQQCPAPPSTPHLAPLCAAAKCNPGYDPCTT